MVFVDGGVIALPCVKREGRAYAAEGDFKRIGSGKWERIVKREDVLLHRNET